jgi:catechol 2,3-dioxygenase
LMANAPEEDWSEMPAETIIGHIHLHVSELSQSERFYCDGLGFEVVNRYGSQALFLSSGKYHHHIGVNTWQGVGAPIPHPNSVGLAHFTVAYPDEKTRDQTIEQLKRMDASLTKMEEGFRAIDPSGNTILIDIHNEGR